MAPHPINVKRKQSVYLDKDLQSVISSELAGLHSQGYLDVTVSDIIKKRLREAFGIPGAAAHGK